ncbi:MAG TPA: hypothetical protein PKE29_00905 [Phycisphaerales bacterium]|nr:hypothetical protein [Phycisphaerales bacterium]
MSQYGSPSHVSGEFNVPTDPPAWPKVVGIISIVLGSVGTVCGLCAAVFTFAMGPFLQKMGELQQQAQSQGGARGGGPMLPTTPMPAELAPGPLSMASAVFWPIGTIILIVAGIATLRRAAKGRTLHLGYAGLSLLFTLIGFVGAFMYQASSSGYLSSHPDDPWSQFFNGQGGMQNQIPQAVCMTVVAAAYPVFCLVWFGPMGKRPEAGAALPEPMM